MEVVQFTQRYPRLWHMAEVENWELIKEHGLLSTSALLDLFEYDGKEREPIESAFRSESVVIEHPQLGKATIRDQAPMHGNSVVKKFLDDLDPRQWYRTLNSRVFFWVTEERLERLLGAGLYRHRPHMVLELDAKTVLDRYLDAVTLSPINSGAIFRAGRTRRGPQTFRRFHDYPWSQRKGRSELVVELAVDYAVPDLDDLLLRAEVRQAPSSI